MVFYKCKFHKAVSVWYVHFKIHSVGYLLHALSDSPWKYIGIIKRWSAMIVRSTFLAGP